jgi:hypothetical protein
MGLYGIYGERTQEDVHCTIEYGIPIESDSNYGEKRTKIWSESLTAVSLWA